ncbi:RraA-like protein [Powellomyces hirtus]|nr:RraA-like protein [Powellomyces hirtus]
MASESLTSEAAVQLLTPFSSCEISDAATKLSIPVLLVNLCARSPQPDMVATLRMSGPAHTVEFVSASDTESPRLPASIPHHVDVASAGSVIVIKAPSTTPNAVWGGLMSARAAAIGCQGVVVDGRVRDIREHWEIGLPVFAAGQSTLGAGPFTRVSQVRHSITVGREAGYPVVVNHGDIIVGDIDGVVCVPIDRVAEVAQVAAKGIAVDEKCMTDIKAGRGIAETFAEHRGKKN